VKPSWLWIAGVAALAWLARGLALPVFLAIGVRLPAQPDRRVGDARAIRRSVAVAALFAVITAVLLAAGLLLGPRMVIEASALVDGLPALASQIDTRLDGAVRELVEAAPVFRRVLHEGGGWANRFVLDLPPKGPSDLFEHAGHLFLLAILVPFFAFFLLRDLPRIVTAAMDRRLPSTWRPPSRSGASSTASSAATSGAWCWTVSWWVCWPRWGSGRCVCRIPFCSAPSPAPPTWCRSSARCSRPRGRARGAADAGARLAGVVRVAVLFLAIKVLDDTIIQPYTIGRASTSTRRSCSARWSSATMRSACSA